ncbi:hypothetical protein [Rhizobium glycinendophyticum]|uniref:Uncharacterized protein n=1 Tax=Rhizobium glycinendophyticum TaxID=2589807 RepID=A0A504TWC3_9HYPH|nr:hypothetical protein [Rhizobium glycinendophyticum]TPP07028.1 hypothetical protein FJQ55_15310 [Rhizobium glycinendophyticum]
MDKETLSMLFSHLGGWTPLAIAFIIFCVYGMPQIPAIVVAIGKIVNERHKTNLSHKRSMLKIENQLKEPGKNSGE